MENRIDPKAFFPQAIGLLICFGFLLTASRLGFAGDNIYLDPLGEVEVAYRFSQHLPRAGMTIIQRVSGMEERGEWNGEYFDFAELGSRHRTGVAEGAFEGEIRKGIYLFPTKDTQKVIRFSEVPPRSKMVIFYGIEDKSLGKKSAYSHIYLRIQIGRHWIEKIVIPSQKGWKSRVINLGVIAFLHQPLPVTLEFTSDADEEQDFYWEVVLI